MDFHNPNAIWSVLINVKALLFHERYFWDQEDDNLSLGPFLGYCPSDEKEADQGLS